jgi:predicted HTH domain antitoxin
MSTLAVDVDSSFFGTLRLAPDEFVREMKIAAAVQWYAQGAISQEKAAMLAGLSRFDFLDELRLRKVGACQATKDELIEEIHG